MGSSGRTLSWVAVVVLAGIDVATAQVPAAMPLERRAIAIPAWERQSVSPFGGSRIGGSDTRRYAISPAAGRIVSEDAGLWQLELWDALSGRFGQVRDPVALAFSPDGRRLVTAEHDRHGEFAVELWDVESQKLLRQLDAPTAWRQRFWATTS
jgi:hypothetical protein